MTKIDITPVEQMIANLREENERLREINGMQAAERDEIRKVIKAPDGWSLVHAVRAIADENEHLREVNAAQVHQINVAHARIDHLEEQLRKAQQREAARSGVWVGGRLVRSGE
jgi:hypothetical protein